MEHRLSTPHTLSAKAKPENAPIFGLYYLEENEFDLNEVVGCFGAGSVEVIGGSFTNTCPSDDMDGDGEVP